MKREEIELFNMICKDLRIKIDYENDIVGTGHEGKIWKISDRYCLKVSKYKSSHTVPCDLIKSEYLCFPQKYYVSSDKNYIGEILRYKKGVALQKYIFNNVRLDENIVAYIIYDILKGLEVLHRNNYVHRDFYPANIIVNIKSDSADAAIIDLDEMSLVSRNCKACYRFNGYQAPEVLLFDNSYNQKSEVFIVGIIMWELLFGRCEFAGVDFFGRKISDSWDDYFLDEEKNIEETMNAMSKLSDSLNGINGISKNAIQVLNKLLCFDAENRGTSSEILLYDYFSNIRR